MMTLPSRLLLAACLFALACSPDKVDETGYLQPPEIDTTSEEPLNDEEPKKVLVVGRPGAVEVSGGILKASSSSGGSNTVSVTSEDGSFVVAVPATSSDEIELFYNQDGEDTLVLQLQGTGSEEEPVCGGCLTGAFQSPMNGATSIDLSGLTDASPPYVLANENQGVAVVATELRIASIAAEVGDRVCVYSYDENATSRALCETLTQ